jgi:hypothetical protein
MDEENKSEGRTDRLANLLEVPLRSLDACIGVVILPDRLGREAKAL